ncbi:hypothetical protein F2Q69_00004670 [Brassica cretica]|uniref:Uncharacterized protein n=1 Tax=Brassica cretica TaxID=69181 RepID=A0A8S9NSI2_BRACR|nr:hypothetical protein F2Q69_00004670 [Brassica cretica]
MFISSELFSCYTIQWAGRSKFWFTAKFDRVFPNTFDLKADVYAADSMDLLRRSGIDFAENNRSGIEPVRFGDLLMGSGVVLDERIHWATFHCGYDFGYFLKLLTGEGSA